MPIAEMTQTVVFAGMRLSLIAGWMDITRHLPEGSPPTLGRAHGIGTLQVTVVKHEEDSTPFVSQEDLKQLLLEYAEDRALGHTSILKLGRGACHYASATFLRGDDLIHIWYLSNGQDIAFITYTGATIASLAFMSELSQAHEIVDSMSFI